jgi:hypothetical protein
VWRREGTRIYNRVSDTSAPELCRAVRSRISDTLVGRSQLRRRLEKVFG